ncbi:MAG: glycosyltransferase [Cytophagaceae bacterium]|nr:glycosyltransferase [Cytophagaceae bacterium]MDW8456377.1 glycosyltransferase [Cytophagaceae bacterium]
MFIVALIAGWIKTKKTIPLRKLSNTKISVIIPVRNEAENLPKLLNDLNEQTYPFENFEVIVIDDHSEDDTLEILHSFQSRSRYALRVYALTEEKKYNSFKKSAIHMAIEKSQGELIVTTDGDCRVNKEWLKTIEEHYVATGASFLVGSVSFIDTPDNLFTRMQIMEHASITGTTCGCIAWHRPTMCSGANLAYTKAAYNEVNGFDGIGNIASGDDEMLMHKIAESNNHKIAFIKNSSSIVLTYPAKKLKEFYQQRIRWASKWKHYQNTDTKILALFIFFYHFTLLICAVYSLMNPRNAVIFLTLIAMKISFEFVFLHLIMKFLHKKFYLLVFFLLAIFHPVYVVIIALRSRFEKYGWKGRTIQQI